MSKHTENANARSGQAVTDQQPPQDGAHVEPGRQEPSSYAARNWQEASLAPPAAGEVTDFFDEGEPSGGAQQGATRTRVPEYDAAVGQGRKTGEMKRRLVKSGSPDQSTR